MRKTTSYLLKNNVVNKRSDKWIKIERQNKEIKELDNGINRQVEELKNDRRNSKGDQTISGSDGKFDHKDRRYIRTTENSNEISKSNHGKEDGEFEKQLYKDAGKFQKYDKSMQQTSSKHKLYQLENVYKFNINISFDRSSFISDIIFLAGTNNEAGKHGNTYERERDEISDFDRQQSLSMERSTNFEQKRKNQRRSQSVSSFV